MRRFTSFAVATATAVLLAAVPASAAVDEGGRPTPDNDWVPVPSAPFEQPAGITCDFPIRGEPVLDRVVKLVLERYPDGSVKREMYTGALLYRVINVDTGTSVEVDISGSSVLDIRPGGSYGNNVTWNVWGPILLGMHQGKSNYPAGMYVPNGIYTVRVSESGYRKLTFTVGGARNLCDELSATAYPPQIDSSQADIGQSSRHSSANRQGESNHARSVFLRFFEQLLATLDS